MQFLKNLDRASSDAMDAGEDYLEQGIRYYKLKIFQILAGNLAIISKMAIIGGILFLGILLMAVAASFAFGELLESTALGFVVVAGFLLLLALIIYLGRKEIIDRKVLNTMSKTFFDDRDEHI